MPKLSTANLSTPSSRKRCKPRPKPFWHVIGPGLSLGYRRVVVGPGSWTVRVRTPDDEWTERIGTADDEGSESELTMSYTQAIDAARAVARGRKSEGGNRDALTVAKALDRYEEHLVDHGDPLNARRVRCRMGDLANKTLDELRPDDLNGWLKGLAKEMTDSGANRTRTALRAALTHAADHDGRAIERVWENHKLFPPRPGGDKAKNVVLSDKDIERWIEAAYEYEHHLGVLVDVLAGTGARPSQVARLQVRDLNMQTPHLNMPKSSKGHFSKRVQKAQERVQVSITRELAATLKAEAAGRPADAPLLTKRNGKGWGKEPIKGYRYAIEQIVKKLGLRCEQYPDEEVTMYALRHSSITRMLLTNPMISAIAKHHDTSIVKIEQHYGKHLDKHSDSIIREGLFRRKPTLKLVG